MARYNYHIYYPASYHNNTDQEWPLILFLHGAGERGNDLELVKQQGLPKYLQDKADFPFVVAYPQCPSRSYWQMPLLSAWLTRVLSEVRADTSRIYLTGISMGGYGAWDFASRYPDYFAAVAPICGGGIPRLAGRLKDIPVWAFHGLKDDAVPEQNRHAWWRRSRPRAAR